MAEAVRTYLNLINNLSAATRNWAVAAGRAVLAQAGLDESAADASQRLTKLAEEITNAGRANRQMLGNLIGSEVEQLVARLGFARTDEVDLLREELVELRTRLVEAELAAAAAQAAGRGEAAPQRPAASTRAPREKAARTTAAKRATPATPVKKAPAATRSAVKQAPATKAPRTSPPATTTEG